MTRVTHSIGQDDDDLDSPKSTLKKFVISSSTFVCESVEMNNTQYNGHNSIANRNYRLSLMAQHLRNSAQNEDELDVFIKLISLEEERVSNLERPYLICKPTMSIGQLCEYVALKTTLQTEEIELYVVKECNPNIIFGDVKLDANNIKSELLTREDQTLAQVIPDNLVCGYLVIAYKKKMWDLNI